MARILVLPGCFPLFAYCTAIIIRIPHDFDFPCQFGRRPVERVIIAVAGEKTGGRNGGLKAGLLGLTWGMTKVKNGHN